MTKRIWPVHFLYELLAAFLQIFAKRVRKGVKNESLIL
jgi:hypothetical protein